MFEMVVQWFLTDFCVFIHSIFRSSAAIEAEKKIQRDTIRKQRDDYIKRSSALKRELIALKEQREELILGNEPPSPTTKSFINENDRLQVNVYSIYICLVVLQHFFFTIYSLSFTLSMPRKCMNCISFANASFYLLFNSINFSFHLFYELQQFQIEK